MLNREEFKKEIRTEIMKYNDLGNYDVKTLSDLKIDKKRVEREVKSKKSKIEKLLLEIEILESESVTLDNVMKDLQNKDTKKIIFVKEHPKTSKYSNYSLYLKLCIVDKETNRVIENIDEVNLSFKERGEYKNKLILNWINKNNVSEIHSNMNLKKIESIISENNIKILELK